MKRSKGKGVRHPKSKQPVMRKKVPGKSEPFDSRSTIAPVAIPGEFETQEALVFGCGQLVRHFPQVFVDFVRATHEKIKLVGVISPEYRRQADFLISAAGVPSDAVEFLEGVTSSVWARDWSPTFGYDASGNRCQFCLDRAHMRHRDDVIAADILKKKFSDPQHQIPLTMEGGNILSNGQGLLITSNTVEVANASRKYDRVKVGSIFESTFRSRQWASLVQLHGERTGHVDLYATFLAPDFLVIGQVDKSVDEINAHSLDQAAESLDGLDTSAGKLKVARIPMPCSKDTFFRSYNNVIFANKTLLVPCYPTVDPKLDRRVLDIYREYLPDYEVVGIDIGDLDKKGGGLHCLSTNVPPRKRKLYSAK